MKMACCKMLCQALVMLFPVVVHTLGDVLALMGFIRRRCRAYLQALECPSSRILGMYLVLAAWPGKVYKWVLVAVGS